MPPAVGGITDSSNMREWVAIARVIGCRGNRGEVAAQPLSSHPDRYRNSGHVFLFAGNAPVEDGRAFEIEDAWEHRGRIILKFRGVDNIDDAGRLVGLEVRVPLSERVPLPEGEYYQSDLVGCEVFDARTGTALGKVEEFQETGGSGVLKLAGPAGEELLIPFAKSVCLEINPAARRIVVSPPEGLLELNR
jgi:16S rRNA processing protein RimM